MLRRRGSDTGFAVDAGQPERLGTLTRRQVRRDVLRRLREMSDPGTHRLPRLRPEDRSPSPGREDLVAFVILVALRWIEGAATPCNECFSCMLLSASFSFKFLAESILFILFQL